MQCIQRLPASPSVNCTACVQSASLVPSTPSCMHVAAMCIVLCCHSPLNRNNPVKYPSPYFRMSSPHSIIATLTIFWNVRTHLHSHLHTLHPRTPLAHAHACPRRSILATLTMFRHVRTSTLTSTPCILAPRSRTHTFTHADPSLQPCQLLECVHLHPDLHTLHPRTPLTHAHVRPRRSRGVCCAQRAAAERRRCWRQDPAGGARHAAAPHGANTLPWPCRMPR
jgi:hypothetical protein